MKWYVNLSGDMRRGRSANHGPRIPIVVTRKFGHTSKSHRLRRAAWTLTWAPATHDNYMLAAPRLEAGAETPESDEKRFENAVAVPPIGGITYDVKVRKALGQGVDNVRLDAEFVSWRRLYYTVNYMNDATKRLFESIVDDLKTTYRACFIELKHRQTLRARGGDEAVTVRPNNDPTLRTKHAGATDREPFHLRILLVNDVAKRAEKRLEWEMSQVPGVDDIAYASPKVRVTTHLQQTAKVRDFKVRTVTITPRAAPVVVPAERISRPTEQTVRVGLTVAQWEALNERRRKIGITGTLRGRKADGVITASALRATVQIRGENDSEARVTAAGMSVWFADRKVHVELNDAHVFHGDLTVSLYPSDTAPQRFPTGEILRPGSKKLELPLAHAEAVESALGDGRVVTVYVNADRRREVELDPEADHALAGYVEEGYRQEQVGSAGFIAGVGGGPHILISLTDVLISAENPLTEVRLVIDEPAITLNDPDESVIKWADDASWFEIDLSQGGLAAARDALGAGRTIKAALAYEWLSSVGGYHTSDTNTVVLTCNRLYDDDTDEITRRRTWLIACHEIGHALGLVRSEQATQAGDEANGRHYIGHGGQGDHCNQNAVLDGEGNYIPAHAGDLCIMFHTVRYLNRFGNGFCDVCRNHLIRNQVVLP